MQLATLALAALAVERAAAHATFQDLWVNNYDLGQQCVRLPPSNNPVTDVTSTDIRCNVGGTQGVAGKCLVKAGDTLTVEMHQQPGDRNCANQAIGGAHWGPVQVYLTKVADASKADGSTGWYKIFQDGWAHNSAGASGDDDWWGTKDLNTCCGRMSFKVPSDTASGDYLLRAEALALHVAAASGQAQFYMSCYQITVSGSGSGSPGTVSFPGAYKASDPGILVDIHASLKSAYVVPGPTVYSGGGTKSAGATCSAGVCEATCTPGSNPTGTATSVAVAATGGGGSCQQTSFGQCGGNGYTGCTKCPGTQTCNPTSPTYYSQCA